MAKVPTAKKVKKEKKQKPVVIFYQDAINYGDVAEILLNKLNNALIASKDLALMLPEPESLTPPQFAEELSSVFNPTALHDLMESEIGQGIILGAYLVNKAHEEEQLAELEASYG